MWGLLTKLVNPFPLCRSQLQAAAGQPGNPTGQQLTVALAGTADQLHRKLLVASSRQLSFSLPFLFQHSSNDKDHLAGQSTT